MQSMSKIVGLCDSSLTSNQIFQTLTKMIQSYAIPGDTEIYVEDAMGIGVVSPKPNKGVFHDREHLLTLFTCGRVDAIDEKRNPEKNILENYEKRNSMDLESFQGTFIICLFDRKRRAILVGNDRTGQIPFYWYHDNQCTAFASEIKALLPYSRIQRIPDFESWGNLLSYGFVLGDKTLLIDIKRIPSATIIRIADNYVESKKYWNYNNILIDYKRSRNDLIEDGITIIGNAIRRRAREVDNIVIPLSGGYDSRCISAFMPNETNAHITTITGLCHSNGFMEKNIAAEVARFLELPNKYIPPPPNLFKTYFVEQIFLTDGLGDTDEFIWAMPFLSKLNSKFTCFDGLGIDVLLRGSYISRETWKYGWENDVAFAERMHQRAQYVQKRLYNNDPNIFEFFCDDTVKLMKISERSVLDEIHQTIRGPNRSTIFAFSNPVRNATSLGTFNMEYRICPVCCPFLDYDVLEYALSIPPRIKFEEPFRFYGDILRTKFPDLMKIPSTNPPENREPISPAGLSGFPHNPGGKPQGLINGILYAIELTNAIEIPAVIRRSELKQALSRALKRKLDPGPGVLACLRYIVWHELFINLTSPQRLIPHTKLILNSK